MSMFVSAASDSDLIKGAACLVRSGDNVVLIHESLTQKWSLPAGSVKGGEDPANTAQRETWEETGLVVSVKGELLRTETAIIYDCVSDSDLMVYQHYNRDGGHDLPVWFAPHYGVEIESAMLVNPQRIPKESYRFPTQLRQISTLLAKATDQPTTYLTDLRDAAPLWHQMELSWIVAAQSWVHSLPTNVTFAVENMVMLGNYLTSPLLLFVLFPLVCWYFDKSFCYKVLFTFTVTSLLTLLAQHGFSLPRPHAYFPTIGLVSSSGFNLPSLSLALWTSIGLLLLHESNKLNLNQWMGALLLLMVWISSAGFYSGSAFVIDSLSGVILGALCTWHMIRLEGKSEINLNQLLTTKGIWFALCGVCVVLAAMWPTPTFVYWLVALVTIFLVVRAKYFDCYHLSLTQAIMMVAVLLVIDVVFNYLLTFTSTSSSLSLLVEALRYPTLIIVFVLPMRLKVRLAHLA